MPRRSEAKRAGAPLAVLAALLLTFTASAAAVSAQDRAPPSPDSIANANACLVWIDSLLANAWYQVAKNGCDYPIRIEYRYEVDIGAGCFGPRPCADALEPHETRRFRAGPLRHWACRSPAAPRFPDLTRDGWCEPASR